MIDCLAVDAVSGEALGMLASLVIAAVLVLVGWVVLPWLTSPRSRATGPDALGGRAGNDAQTQPAIVNLVLTNCVPGAAAYQGTILDLAARGFLAVSNDPGHLGVALAQPPVAPAGRARRAVFTPLIAVIVFWCGLGWLEHQDRLTAVGSALAAQWKRERADLAAAGAAWEDVAPASLQRRAFAVAAGNPRAVPLIPVAAAACLAPGGCAG